MSADKKFGTFGGVYTPSLLTILGVIMYLRLPWVVGSAGLYQALGIILVAHVISISTGLSISSIATDKAVGAGGPYYIISRSLGLPIGGTLGLALFVGLAFSISLYIIGFSESLLTYFKLGATVDNIRICGTAVLIALTIVTFISTALAIKTQYLILTLIGLSLVSIIVGSGAETSTSPHLQASASAEPLPAVFAIFFPAVTGFTAGVNMSGDLRSPKRSIPGGTMLAIVTGMIVYIGLSVFLAYRVPADRLVSDPELLINVAWSGPLVVAGIWGATISSALGSILGSPRILQAVSGDGITPRVFARGYGPTHEPRNALALAFVIGEAGILIGELDAIARIVSMVFLTTYCVLNLSCALESWASPDFRPEFRIPRSISIVGAITCLVVMIQLDLPAMIGSMALMALLFLHLSRRQLRLESGDTWEGIWDALVRAGLHRLASGPRQERHWKPNVLAFSTQRDATQETGTHSELALALATSSGIVTHVHLSPRPPTRPTGQPSARPSARALPQVSMNPGSSASGAPPGSAGDARTHGVFYRDLPCGPDPDATIVDFCNHHGFAGVEPNTVLLRWSEYESRPGQLAALLSDLSHIDFNELVWAQGGRADEPDSPGAQRRIDIWWRDHGGNIPLSLSLARFVTSSQAWEHTSIRILLLSDNASNNDILRARVRRYLKTTRVEADIKVINNTLQVKGYEDWVRSESADANLVLVPLPDQPSEADTHFLTRAARILPELAEVLFVRASSSFEEVLSTGQSATESLLPGPAGDEDAFALPELRLPSPTALAEAASELAGHYEQILAALDEHCVARVHSQSVELVRRLRRTLERHFAPLEKSLVGANARRRRQLLNRFQSSFVMDAHEIIDAHLREGLVDQQATLEGHIEAFLDEERLVGGQPEKLRVERERQEFRPDPEDPPHLRRFKRRQRIRSFLGRKNPRCWVPWTALRRHCFDRAVREILEPTASQLVIESHQLAVHLGTTLSGSRAGITAIIGKTADEEVSEAALADLKQSALAPLDELIERTKGRVLEQRRELIARGHDVLQQLCDDLDRLDVARHVRKERRVPRRRDTLRNQLGRLPKEFGEVQRKLHERAKLGLTVSSFHHRLTAIVQRQKEALTLQLRNGALRVCEDVGKALSELGSTLETPGASLSAPRPASRMDDRFDPKETLAALRTEVEPAIADLPESVQMLTDPTVDSLEGGHAVAAETTELSLRSLGQFLVESELLAGVYEQLDPVPEAENRAVTVARDVTRLVGFQLSELEELGLTGQDQRRDHMESAIASGLERLGAEIRGLHKLVGAVDDRFDAQLARVLEESNPSRLGDAGHALGQHRRLRQGKIAVSGAQGVLRRAEASIRQAMVSLLYQGSAGLVLARALSTREGRSASVVERLRSLVRDNSPQDTVLSAVPYYYRQLFFGQALNDSFWVGRERELARARKAVASHRSGTHGIVLVIGEPGSGKTALCQRVVTRALEQRPAVWVRPPSGGSTDPAAFHTALERALGRSGEPDELLDTQPEHAAIIIDDLEMWWERSADGFAVLDEVLALIERHGHRQLFILSINRQAFRLISQLRPIADHALSVLECGPMAARELGSILTLRHGSTGMKFEYRGKREEQLSSWQLARLFSRHFSYGGGSVGGALRSWISHVERVRDGVMTLRAPVKPNPDLLSELRAPWRALLLELLLHRRMTLARLERVAGLPVASVRSDVDALVRAGLLIRGRHELLEINPFVQPLISQHFETQGLLAA